MLALLKKLFPSAFMPESAESGDQEPYGGGVLVEDEPQPAAWWQVGRPGTLRTENSEELLLNRSLHEQLVAILDDSELEIPRIPQVAQRALLAMRDENANFRELSQLIGQDPGLSADVLRVANSPAYRGDQTIRSLEQAFSRMGLRTLRSLILSATMRTLTIRVGAAQRTLGEDIWRAALASAIVLKSLARRIGLAEEESFLVGLLHDVGALVTLRVVNDFQQCHGRVVPIGLFERLTADWHERVGLRLAKAWNLPDPLPALIGEHHAPVNADDPLARQRYAIALADSACWMLGYRGAPCEHLLASPAARALNLREDPELVRILDEIPGQVSALFNS